MKAILIGTAKDTSGEPISVAITRGKHVTLVGACAVLPLSRAAARRLISLLEEAVNTLE